MVILAAAAFVLGLGSWSAYPGDIYIGSAALGYALLLPAAFVHAAWRVLKNRHHITFLASNREIGPRLGPYWAVALLVMPVPFLVGWPAVGTLMNPTTWM